MPVHAFCTEHFCKKSESTCDPTKVCLNKNDERHGMCGSCPQLRHKCFRVNNVCQANVIVDETQFRVCTLPAIGSDEYNLSLCLDCSETKNVVRNGGFGQRFVFSEYEHLLRQLCLRINRYDSNKQLTCSTPVLYSKSTCLTN